MNMTGQSSGRWFWPLVWLHIWRWVPGCSTQLPTAPHDIAPTTSKGRFNTEDKCCCTFVVKWPTLLLQLVTLTPNFLSTQTCHKLKASLFPCCPMKSFITIVSLSLSPSVCLSLRHVLDGWGDAGGTRRRCRPGHQFSVKAASTSPHINIWCWYLPIISVLGLFSSAVLSASPVQPTIPPFIITSNIWALIWLRAPVTSKRKMDHSLL